MGVRFALFLALTVAACAASISIGPGCQTYGAQRISMPRPLPNDELGKWVATLDAAMTGACR